MFFAFLSHTQTAKTVETGNSENNKLTFAPRSPIEPVPLTKRMSASTSMTDDNDEDRDEEKAPTVETPKKVRSRSAASLGSFKSPEGQRRSRRLNR